MSRFKLEFNVRRSDWKDVRFIIYNLLPCLELMLYTVFGYIWSIQANTYHWGDVVRWTGFVGVAVVFGVLITLTKNLARRRLDILHSKKQ